MKNIDFSINYHNFSGILGFPEFSMPRRFQKQLRFHFLRYLQKIKNVKSEKIAFYQGGSAKFYYENFPLFLFEGIRNQKFPKFRNNFSSYFI